MGNPKAFLTVPRQDAGYRPIHERIADFGEVEQWHTKYLPLRMIFPNLRAAFARHCAKKVVCLSCL